MQFSSLLLAAATLAVANAANFTMGPTFFASPIPANSQVTITWTGASGGVSLYLADGNIADLQIIQQIGPSGLTGGSYTWTPPTSLPDNAYAFEIKDDSGTNYSAEWVLSGGQPSSLISSQASTSTSSGSSSSSTRSSTTASTTASSSLSSNSTASSSLSSSSTGSTTTTTKSTSTTASSTSSSTGASTSTTAPKSSASGLTSPLAFVLFAFAAILTFH